jgi:hypothetical protein
MGFFDFLKSNKNIITDNGTNYIYYDNGKGSIKEKFNKINGVFNGDYFEYNRDGTFNFKKYINGIMSLTGEEILLKNQEEELHNNIKVEISKLKIIDELISEISGIFLMVQMENSKIDYYSKLIVDKYNNKLEEDYIKFYLYTKRNYFIKQLIEFNLPDTKVTSESLNDINTKKCYNKRFTEHIVNYFDNFLKLKSKRGIIKVNYSDSYFVESNILSKLFLNFKVTSELVIYGNDKDIIKEIFTQQSLLFGLNFKTYKLIHEIIMKKSEEFKYHYNEDLSRDFFELFENERLKEDGSFMDIETSLTPSQMDIYAQKVVNEILSICTNNKVNQKDIAIEL